MNRKFVRMSTILGGAALAAGLLAGPGARLVAGADSSTTFASYESDGRSQVAASIPAIGGGSTTVTLDPGTAQVLQQNGVTVAPVAPATASTEGGGIKVSFPVIGGEAFVYAANDLPFIRGDVLHSGGLTFSAGSKSLTITDFLVNPGTSLLTAKAGDKALPVFELDGRNVKIGHDSSGNVTLDGTIVRLSPMAAAALNATFGVTLFKEGIPVGVAHIVLQAAS